MVEKEMEVFRTLQGEIQELSSKQQQFLQQANENGMVKKELDYLKEDDKVYKLIGPLLIKQRVPDAVLNINKRLEFIQNEIEKVSSSLTEKENKAGAVRQKVNI